MSVRMNFLLALVFVLMYMWVVLSVNSSDVAEPFA